MGWGLARGGDFFKGESLFTDERLLLALAFKFLVSNAKQDESLSQIATRRKTLRQNIYEHLIDDELLKVGMRSALCSMTFSAEKITI